MSCGMPWGSVVACDTAMRVGVSGWVAARMGGDGVAPGATASMGAVAVTAGRVGGEPLGVAWAPGLCR